MQDADDPAQDAAGDAHDPDAGTDSDAEPAPLDAEASDAEPHPPRDASVEAEAAAPLPCDSVAPTACPAPSPKYADVVPVLEARCLTCHDGLGDQWALTSYDHVVSWTDQIRGMMLSCSMPPIESGIEMPVAERQLILDWLRCNAPR
jgi:hypothetical protein